MAKSNTPIELSTFRELYRLYFIALGVIAMTIIVSQFLVQKHLKGQKNDSRLINIAGQQRMLSQQLAKEALLLNTKLTKEKREILQKQTRQNLVMWQQSHQDLRYGNQKRGFSSENSLEVQSMFETIEIHYELLGLHIKNILQLTKIQGDVDEVANELIAVLENEALFLEGMNKIVFQFDKEAKEKVILLRKKELLLFGLALSILLLEFLVIFRPAAFKVRNTIKRLVAFQMEDKKRHLEVNKFQEVLFQEKISQQKNISSGVVQAQEEERKRIARDLHDDIGQTLIALKFNIQSINLDKPQQAAQKLNYINDISTNIIKKIRVVTFNLIPPELSNCGIASTLSKLVDELKVLTNQNIAFQNITDFHQRLGPNIETNLYRITQEALNNAIKYSQSSLINVSISHNETHLTLKVKDDGIGFDSEKFNQNPEKKGFGFIFMKERVNFIDGKIEIKSKQNLGTEIQVTLHI